MVSMFEFGRGLGLWQGILASLNDPWDGAEEMKDYARRIALRAGDEGKRAADYGTEIHAHVCEMLGGSRATSRNFILSQRIAESVCEWLKAEGYTVLHPERTVVNARVGSAGTIDVQAEWREKKILLDLKTQNFPHTFYKEHRWQLAGYDDLLDGWADERHVLYIDRTTVGNLKREVCTEPSKDDRVWQSIHNLWVAVNNY